MAEGLAYRGAAVSGYDRAFGHVSARSVPSVQRAARLAPKVPVQILFGGGRK